jgi:adenosine deaminase CECR1
MEAYLKDREELIASERALRSGAARVQGADDVERKADAIVRKVREQEARTIWKVEHTEDLDIIRGEVALDCSRIPMD